MALDLPTLKAHCNVTDDFDDVLLERLLSASTAHAERVLGFAIGDATEFPDGTPADVEQAVLMIAADWYENREASLIGVTGQPVPLGATQILNEHRTYSFGVGDDE